MKIVITANFVILILLLVVSIVRDLTYQEEGAGDLRNGVVGAWLMKADKDPYFYKWKSGESYRYLDYSISINRHLLRFLYLLIFSGILLNVSNTALIPMRHTIGEYMILAGLLLIIFNYQHKKHKGREALL